MGAHLERRENASTLHTFLIKTDHSLSIKKLISFLLKRIGILLKVDDLEVYSLGPVKIEIAVCYEAEIPEISRILSVKGATSFFAHHTRLRRLVFGEFAIVHRHVQSRIRYILFIDPLLVNQGHPYRTDTVVPVYLALVTALGQQME
ncbi:hypothetical protein ACDZ29_23535 [Peribacillus sp. RS7]|uniref:hypothetical protein n=1 Tax=Peribacillus sp. RS7 TaxID=3242679 RepID=UPI0035C071FD